MLRQLVEKKRGDFEKKKGRNGGLLGGKEERRGSRLRGTSFGDGEESRKGGKRGWPRSGGEKK